jgi:chromosome segregation ATPase
MPSHFFAQVSWGTFGTALTLVVFVAAALIVIFSRRREEVQATLTANVSALKEYQATLERKLKAAEDELKGANERVESLTVKAAKLENELKAAGLEYNQLALLDVAEWLKADRLKRENEALREEIRELEEENRGLLRSQKKAD